MDYAKLLLSFLIFTGPACAQTISFGVKIGGRLTDDLQSSGRVVSESKRHTMGPMVEFKLPFRLTLEIDALLPDAHPLRAARLGAAESGGSQADARDVRLDPWGNGLEPSRRRNKVYNDGRREPQYNSRIDTFTIFCNGCVGGAQQR